MSESISIRVDEQIPPREPTSAVEPTRPRAQKRTLSTPSLSLVVPAQDTVADHKFHHRAATELVLTKLFEVHRATVAQQQINATQSKLHALNFFLNYCNASKIDRVAVALSDCRDDIEQGQIIVKHMESRLVLHEQALEHVQTDLEDICEELKHEQEAISGIETRLSQQDEYIRSSFADCEKELERQRLALEEQNRALQHMLRVRFKIDFLVDSGLGILSLWLANSTPVHLLSRWMAYVLLLPSGLHGVPAKRATANIHRLCRLAACVALYLQLRHMAKQNGVHNSIGTFARYWNAAVDSMWTVMHTSEAWQSAKTSLSNITGLAVGTSSSPASPKASVAPAKPE